MKSIYNSAQKQYFATYLLGALSIIITAFIFGLIFQLGLFPLTEEAGTLAVSAFYSIILFFGTLLAVSFLMDYLRQAGIGLDKPSKYKFFAVSLIGLELYVLICINLFSIENTYIFGGDRWWLIGIGLPFVLAWMMVRDRIQSVNAAPAAYKANYAGLTVISLSTVGLILFGLAYMVSALFRLV